MSKDNLEQEIKQEKKNGQGKVTFNGFKRTNLSKKDIKKFNQMIDEEVKKIDTQIAEVNVSSEKYNKLLETRAELLNQRIEKEPSKWLEHSLRYGLPIVASVAVTLKYYSMQDPSQEGRTWKDTLGKLFSFRN